jgi:NADP-dependent 3-hydroxy acid dehydrogenase YdfG
MTREDEISRRVEKVLSEFATIDILVYNAGRNAA